MNEPDKLKLPVIKPFEECRKFKPSDLTETTPQ